jgi:hypothetical protein
MGIGTRRQGLRTMVISTLSLSTMRLGFVLLAAGAELVAEGPGSAGAMVEAAGGLLHAVVVVLWLTVLLCSVRAM